MIMLMSTEATTQRREAWPSIAARQVRRGAPFFLVAGLVFGLDQLTKAAIRGWLAIGESWPSDGWLVKITHVTNTGAAFGILQGQGLFLTVTAVIAIGAIVFYYMFPPLEHGLLRLAMGLELGGAAGNLLDRVRFGHVTDFIDFPRYPEFNVADSSIVIGLIIITGFFLLSDQQREARPDGD
jgi:signal peptidase II